MTGQSGKGLVLRIERASWHDGPGLRTTVFLKGCPLRCLWCHNPESIRPGVQIGYNAEGCLSCGACVQACEKGCHSVGASGHQYQREGCVACGSCVRNCPAQALQQYGQLLSVEQVMQTVLADRAYYERSGGGLTCSGGEPMMQPEFVFELFGQAKAAGLHTCLDTCGHAVTEDYQRILPRVDLFLFDIKETDPVRHREYTGVDNTRILANLATLDKAGATIILRCPIIPGLNDRSEHLLALAALAQRHRSVREINLLPFHPYGQSKARFIEMKYPLAEVSAATEGQLAMWMEQVAKASPVPVRRG